MTDILRADTQAVEAQLTAALGMLAEVRPDLEPRFSELRAAAIEAWDLGVRPVRALVELGVELTDLERAVWVTQGFEYLPRLPDLVAPELVERMGSLDGVDLGAFPVGRHGDTVVIAVVNPHHREMVSELHKRFTEFHLEIVVTTRDAIEEAVANHEDLGLIDDLIDEDSADLLAQLKGLEAELIAAGRIAELADLLIERAIVIGASDLHIEPDAQSCEVRFRLDGMLSVAGRYPGGYAQTLINRIKIMGQLDVGDRRTPQDGRASAVFGARTVDLRIVTIPSAWGTESCVVRLLDQNRLAQRLEGIGFSRPVRAQFDRMLAGRGGVLLATGPTGSGKTTTLYSALQTLTTENVKTITVEDPVEYRLPGMLQVQVNRAADFDFAAALRSILRADPEVILVGEIRDTETALVAMAAALTGQTVLASLHTGSAVAAPIRLIDLGAEAFVVSAALRGVIDQRLLRRLCRRCRVPFAPRRAQLDEAAWPFARPDRLWMAHPEGCPSCFHTGYRGRQVVAEVLTLDDEMRAAITTRAEPAEIELLAVANNMVPIRHDALQLARQGATSLEEISRVLGTH
jgi:type II secretory ATPase GspE/PulE/Tfp pilus assembly ATPase PilB-like protein